MKKSTVKEMFWGEKGTYENIPLSAEYRKVEKQMYAALDAFLEKLDGEQMKLFNEAFDQVIDRNAEYTADHFVEGFKFGLLLGIECSEK